jgi:hypothetical protein
MTILQYNLMTLNDKRDILCEYGLLIDERISESERVRLYTLGEFFVEECLHYNHELKYIKGIESVMDSDRYLNPLYVFNLN